MYTIDYLENISDYANAQFEDARIALRTANEIALETGLDISGPYRDRLDKYKAYVDVAQKMVNYVRAMNAAQPKGPFRVSAPVDPETNPDTRRIFEALTNEYDSN